MMHFAASYSFVLAHPLFATAQEFLAKDTMEDLVTILAKVIRSELIPGRVCLTIQWQSYLEVTLGLAQTPSPVYLYPCKPYLYPCKLSVGYSQLHEAMATVTQSPSPQPLPDCSGQGVRATARVLPTRTPDKR